MAHHCSAESASSKIKAQAAGARSARVLPCAATVSRDDPRSGHRLSQSSQRSPGAGLMKPMAPETAVNQLQAARMHRAVALLHMDPESCLYDVVVYRWTARYVTTAPSVALQLVVDDDARVRHARCQ